MSRHIPAAYTPATFAPPTSKKLYDMCVEDAFLQIPERITHIIDVNTDFVAKNSVRLDQISRSMRPEQLETAELVEPIKSKLLEMTTLLDRVRHYSDLLKGKKSDKELITCIKANTDYSLENLFSEFFKLRNVVLSRLEALEKHLAHSASQEATQNPKRAQGSPHLFIESVDPTDQSAPSTGVLHNC